MHVINITRGDVEPQQTDMAVRRLDRFRWHSNDRSRRVVFSVDTPFIDPASNKPVPKDMLIDVPGGKESRTFTVAADAALGHYGYAVVSVMAGAAGVNIKTTHQPVTTGPEIIVESGSGLLRERPAAATRKKKKKTTTTTKTTTKTKTKATAAARKTPAAASRKKAAKKR